MDLWTILMGRVNNGEMDMEEAHRRANYYCFAKHLPGLDDAIGYVLDTDKNALPPTVMYEDQEIFERFVSFVKCGVMTAYEAAQAYYDAMGGIP